MSLDYTLEKLFVAVSSLASSPLSLQMRLKDAFISALIRLEPDDFPDEWREKFADISRRGRSVDASGDEGTLAATFAVMPDDEAKEVADIIFRMFFDIAQRDPWYTHHIR